MTGGSSADTMDPHAPTNTADGARDINVFEPLVQFDWDYKIDYRLAESLTHNADATVWTVKLRPARFSDGRPVTSRDVQATIERIVDPKSPKNMASGLSMYKSCRILSDRTLEVHLSAPNAVLDDTFAQYSFGIVPHDFDLDHPIGAGAFKLKSFSPGQSTVLERNEHYWEPGKPYLDEIQLLNFNETDAAINALLSSQVDCVAQIPASLVEVIEADQRLKVLNAETGRWLPFTMRVDQAPFDDVRVRQAFRLAADRRQLIEQVVSGHAQHGNDLFAPYDPGTPEDLRREQDIAEAKRLLAAAGHPNGLTVTLNTAPIQSGVVEAAQVFAEQAKAAGITVNINRMDTTAFFGDQYLSWGFAQSFWNTRNFISQARDCLTKASPFNETHWTDEKFLQDLNAAQGETDAARRDELVGRLQEQMFAEGGYIVWGFPNQVDAYQRYVVGLRPNKNGLPLGGYVFRDVWMGEVQ